MSRVVHPAQAPLLGCVRVPGDKSLSHRCVLFGAMAKGTSQLSGVLDSEDVRSTIAAVRALGAAVETTECDGGLDVVIEGWGATGPTAPAVPVNCGNSGTTARLLAGIVAGWPIEVELDGDESLSRRPMRRIAEPLAMMGAVLATAEGGTLPMTVRGSDSLRPVEYASPIASAQVKTAVLLAGLRASGRTSVIEPALSRDHTERLLPAFGVPVERAGGGLVTSVRGPVVPRACDAAVPGDPSSAAFLLVAASLVPGSDVTVEGLSLNPTRVGFLRVLERMGADIGIAPQGETGGEPLGSATARASSLRAVTVGAAEIPSLIDEVPILAVAAAGAEGTTRFEGVGELRVKESDRLAAVVEGLGAMGVGARSGEDWLEVDGCEQLRGASVDSMGDHRLAMALAVAGLVASGPTTIERFESVAVSYPSFMSHIESLMAGRLG